MKRKCKIYCNQNHRFMMHKKGLATKKLIIVMLAVIAFILIILLVNRTWGASNDPVLKEIQLLDNTDFSKLTLEQQEEKLTDSKQAVDAMTDIKKYIKDGRYDEAEKEINEFNDWFKRNEDMIPYLPISAKDLFLYLPYAMSQIYELRDKDYSKAIKDRYAAYVFYQESNKWSAPSTKEQEAMIIRNSFVDLFAKYLDKEGPSFDILGSLNVSDKNKKYYNELVYQLAVANKERGILNNLKKKESYASMFFWNALDLYSDVYFNSSDEDLKDRALFSILDMGAVYSTDVQLSSLVGLAKEGKIKEELLKIQRERSGDFGFEEKLREFKEKLKNADGLFKILNYSKAQKVYEEVYKSASNIKWKAISQPDAVSLSNNFYSLARYAYYQMQLSRIFGEFSKDKENLNYCKELIGIGRDYQDEYYGEGQAKLDGKKVYKKVNPAAVNDIREFFYNTLYLCASTSGEDSFGKKGGVLALEFYSLDIKEEIAKTLMDNRLLKVIKENLKDIKKSLYDKYISMDVAKVLIHRKLLSILEESLKNVEKTIYLDSRSLLNEPSYLYSDLGEERVYYLSVSGPVLSRTLQISEQSKDSSFNLICSCKLDSLSSDEYRLCCNELNHIYFKYLNKGHIYDSQFKLGIKYTDTIIESA